MRCPAPQSGSRGVGAALPYLPASVADMRLHLALALAGGMLAAQQNPFVVFPQDPERQAITCASYVRRPNMTAAAEGHQQIAADWFQGIGDTGAGCSAHGFYTWLADENVTTADLYGIVLRSADPLGNPDPTPGGVIAHVPGLTTPNGSGGPRGGWILIDVFVTPVGLPCQQAWYQGIELPADPRWPTTDGLALWNADSLAAGTSAPVGENHRLGAPNVNWSVDAALATAVSRPWTSLLGVFVDAPVLHLGGIDPASARTGTLGAPSRGMNGIFPAVPAHGLDARVQDVAMPQGLALLVAAYTPAAPIVCGPAGRYYLDLGSTTSVGFGVMNGGAAVIPIASPGTIRPVLIGASIAFQALVLDPATGASRFSNAACTLL